jgi:hypothetical protein
MTYAFSELLCKSMVVFIDDFSTQTSQEEHLEILRACFQRCREFGISLNPENVYLVVVWSTLLGYVISKKGKEPNLNKVELIINLQPPTIVKQIQKVLGHIWWYWDLIENYSTHVAPLTNTKKVVKFEWTQECQDRLNALKEKFTSFPCLLPTDWNKPYHVYYDTSEVAVGSALC